MRNADRFDEWWGDRYPRYNAEIDAKALAAMDRFNATPCGPDDKECDGGEPVSRCPNHGGGEV